MGSGSRYGGLKNEVFFHVAVCIGFVILLVLVLLFGCYAYKKSKKGKGALPTVRNTDVSAEIKDIGVDQNSANHADHTAFVFDVPENRSDEDVKDENVPNVTSYVEFREKKPSLVVNEFIASSPTAGLPELSHAGWGHWFTLRDLEIATNSFSKENVIGEGGYGVVYRGQLINGTIVAVKRILNNLGQVEKEFRVEVDAIGHVRHKNLVRLIGYCIEGTHRLLVYEYVSNGNLEQWLQGRMSAGYLTWEGRMKIILGTANALAYLHEAIDPKVVHRDVKSSNILIDDEFNAKLSDFGLAKLLSAGKSHIITRVMGTYGYVAPEYASSGFLNEKTDVYSFGVVLLETITGRQPVDDSLPVHEKNIVDWMKMMVGANRPEEVIDPFLEVRPSTSDFKRALLIAMRCVDSNVEKRPTMSKVVRMLECKEYPVAREVGAGWCEL